MYNILIWGTGHEYNTHYNCIKRLEFMGQISIVGITSDNKSISTSIDNYPFVQKEDINSLDFDYCLVAMQNISRMVKEAESFGVERSQLIPIRVLSIPYIDFNEYIKVKNSQLTIFSRNCWAGLCYHRLGLEFLSPTLNMWENEDDFNKLMLDLDTYLSCPVEYFGTRYDFNEQREYPVGKLNDIFLHFNHYESFEFDEAVSCWERRKKRINKNNILVVSLASFEKTLYEFENIPYKNKLIFTSLDVHTPSSVHLKPDNRGRLWKVVNKTAEGSYIDLIALLNHKDNYIRIK